MNTQPDLCKALSNSKTFFHIIIDFEGSILQANDYFNKAFQFPSTFFSILSSESAGRLLVIFSELQAMPGESKLINLNFNISNLAFSGIKFEFTSTLIDNKFYIEGLGTPLQLVSGNPTILHPDNAEKLLPTNFLNAAEQYDLLFNHSPLPMWIYDVKTLRFLEVNEAALNHYGYTRDEFLSLTIRDIRPVEEIEPYVKWQNTLPMEAPGKKGYWKNLKKNKEVINVHITITQINFKGQPTKLVMAEDLTEKTRAEENLVKINERYNYAIKATFDAIWDWDLKSNDIYWGEGFRILFGYNLEVNKGDLISRFNYIHPDDKDRVINGIEKAIKHGATSWTDEYKYKKADGTYAIVIDRGIIIRDENGAGLRMIGAMQDVTAQKKNELQLQKINYQLINQQKERELTASILRSLSEKELLNDALEDILRKLTLFFNFDIGEIWFLNIDRNRIELKKHWCASKQLEVFYEMHPEITFKAREKNTLGKSWNENEINFIEDLFTYESFQRKEGVIKLGLNKSLGVPILFNGKIIAVLSFFGKKEFADKEKIKQYFEDLTLQLGIELKRKKTEEELNKFFELSPDILSIIGFDGSFKKVNAAFNKILGYSHKELINIYFDQLVHNDDLIITKQQFKQLEKGNTIHYFENRFRAKDGQYKWLAWASTPITDERVMYATAKDITDKKLMDEKVNRILESISDGFFTVDKDSIILYWNKRAEQILNLKREDVLGRNIFEIFKNVVSKSFFSEYKKAFKNNTPVNFEEFVPTYNTWFEVSAYPNDKILSVFFKDVSERKKSEEIIRVSNERYEVLAKATKDTIWDWNLVTDVTTWNEGLKINFNYNDITETTNTNWWRERIHPEDLQRVEEKVHSFIEAHNYNWEDEYRFMAADGNYKYIFDRGFIIYDDSGKPFRMVGAMQDLTETKANELILKDLNESLEIRAAQLATSNAELERFAYVASHDLQEPLRMVSSFLQLIEKKYKEKLDQKGHEYIRFAVDGAERMKGLILDLLEYSRVNSRKEKKVEVDLNEVASNLLLTYQEVLVKENGKIVFDKLPVVQGVKLQLMQLFQNLIGNALKYKSDLSPEIYITCNDKGAYFEFAFADNGIGIEKRFFDKIFVIFQRLHNKKDYSGTGIGLAICKKIIEIHKGNIWVQSEPGKGSTFYFTLPKVTEDNSV